MPEVLKPILEGKLHYLRGIVGQSWGAGPPLDSKGAMILKRGRRAAALLRDHRSPPGRPPRAPNGSHVTATAVMPRHSAEWIGVPVYREMVVPGASPGTV
jgi:hypothetical protein